jgi:hypothetical protein
MAVVELGSLQGDRDLPVELRSELGSQQQWYRRNRMGHLVLGQVRCWRLSQRRPGRQRQRRSMVYQTGLETVAVLCNKVSNHTPSCKPEEKSTQGELEGDNKCGRANQFQQLQQQVE